MIVGRLALSELRSHPGRTVLPGFALLVGVACLVASLMLGDAMSGAVNAGAERTPQSVGVVVIPSATQSAPPADLTAVAKQLSGMAGVAKVVPVNEVDVDMIGANGRALPNRLTAAVDPRDASLNRYALADGHTPAADGEVVVDKVTAYERHLRPGSQVTLADAAGHPVAVTVSGVTVKGGQADDPFLIIGPTLAAKLNPNFTTTELDLLLAPGANAVTVRSDVAQLIGPGVRVYTAQGLRAGSGGNTLGTLLLLFSILALATSVFVAGATFRAVYLQRQRQTALLRCVGADRGPIVTANLAEALVTGAVAGAAGALLGGAVARLLGWILDVTGVSAMLGAVQLQPDVLPPIGYVVAGVIVAALLSAFAAVRPSLAAARVSPLAALRLAGEATPERKVARNRVIRGLLLVGLAGLFALGALAASKSIAAPFLALFSAIAAVAGLFGSLGPTVVPRIGRAFGWVAGKVLGPHVRLAGVELGRVPQRASAVAMPLVLASAIVAFTLVIIGTAREFALERGGSEVTPDAVISDTGGRPLPSNVLVAAQQPEVRDTVELSRAGHNLTVGDNSVSAAGVDPTSLNAYLAAVGVAKAAPLTPTTALVARWELRDLHLQVGDQFTLTGVPGGPRQLTVAGELPDVGLDNTDVLIGDPRLAPVTTVLVSLKPGWDQSAYSGAVTAALPNAPTVSVTTAAQNSQDLQRNLDLGAITLMVLLGLSVAVAVTGIGTALSISVQERRKELALRRALGVSRRGVQVGIVAEAVLLALTGLLGGGALGTGYAALLMACMGVYAMPALPGVQLAIGGIAVVVLAVLAAVLPARMASRVGPAAGLASG